MAAGLPELERRIAELEHALRQAEDELEQFAYVVSHDLRQPLRIVGSYIALLDEELQGRLDGELPEYMAFAREGVGRMDRLIADLLAYSRVGRSGDDGPVDAARALQAAILDLGLDGSGKVLVEGFLPTVPGDEAELGRLFLNLLGNAVKYRHPDRPPQIRVGCDDRGADWRFRVVDNGIGVVPEHAERVFGIFQRLHARDEYEGTGIGLAICRKIVARRGGRIWIDPAPGGGSAVLFTWPKGGTAMGEPAV